MQCSTIFPAIQIELYQLTSHDQLAIEQLLQSINMATFNKRATNFWELPQTGIYKNLLPAHTLFNSY